MYKQEPTLGFQNYQIIDCLHQGSKTLVYRATQTSDGQPVILKLLRNEYPSFNELLRFRNQYTITKNLSIPGIVPIYDIKPYKNSYILVMEDLGGISLPDYVQEHQLTLVETLNIAIQLAKILHDLHQARVIHKDIKPANILIHPQSKQVWLIDFSIASLLPKETLEIQNPNVLEGTLAYIAPEQTGRMNRGIDYRTDFYSLGVTLYELLTGNLPFQSDDVMEMVHCHIAKIPTFPHTLPSTPHTLIEIVLKLMAKNAEDRYQSALGLKHDLEQCLIQWKETGNITNFKLGERDLSEHFLIPEKLYGREQEVQVLLDAFDRVAIPPQSPLQKGGGTEMMLVAGYSGVGKTAVINEVHKPITRQQGYFIKGKFDQFNRNIPFSAFVQAFRSLMGQLLSESDAELANWQEKILQALGESGQVLIDVIPELEHIIGQQPPVPELSGTAAQNRFNLLFSKFVQVFTNKEHPLVIFLDDLQWADSASLNLLKLLIIESETRYLLVLGAYRDNEVFPAHPLMLTLDEIQDQGANLNTLTLMPLSETDITHLVADTLLCSTELAKPLSQLVYQKTKGNPFFTTQFLTGLHEDSCITFDPDARYWQCNMAQVRQLALTDDVVEFMVRRLQKLPETTQNILKLAACIGNQFNLKTLAVICELNQDEVAVNLWAALQEGFVIPENETYKFFQGDQQVERTNQSVSVNYRFLHDRVQQAAYTLIPDTQKQFTHYQIGQLLLQNQSEEKHTEQIFDIVNQLNLGQDIISNPTEKYQLARLNQQAGQKAKLSAAYQAAQNYYKTGIDLLPTTAWQSDYLLMYELHRDASEAAYLCGNFHLAETLYEMTLSQAKNALDQAMIYRVQMTQYQLQSRYAEAITIQRQCLKLLGWDVPKTPDRIQASLDQNIEVVNQFLESSTIESILELPKMENTAIAEMMRILQILFYAAFLNGQTNLGLLAVAKMTTLSLKYGNSDMSPFGYVGYGMIANGLLNHSAIAYQFGSMAVQLCEQFDNADVRGMTNFLFAADVHSWSRPLREADPYYEHAFQYGIEAGNWLTVSFMMMQSGSDRLSYGKNLEELYEIARTHADFLQRIKSLENRDALMAGVLQPIRDLLGLTEAPNCFNDNDFSEVKYLEKYSNAPYHLAWFYSVKIRHAYLFQQSDQYLDLIPKLDIIENTVPSHAKVPSSVFYVALMHLSLVTANDDIQSQFHWQAVISLKEKLDQWQQNCPENIHHKYLLIQAEIARLQGQIAEAIDYYEQAITQAQVQGYIYEEALANELAAKFYLNWGKEKIAQTYMIEAYYCYSRWGAKAKVYQLEQQYPELLSLILQQPKKPLDTLQTLQTIAQTSAPTYQVTTTSSTHLLDLTSVMKASQALSGEIELEKLVTQLMQVILENAGATKGVLIFNRGKQLTVEAVATQSSGSHKNLTIHQQTLPIEDSLDVPLKLVNRVKRKLQPLMFNQVMAESEWATDQYLLKHHPQSLLCFPILNQGKLLAILYLENALMAQVFTPERVEILKLLCSQAAISLENADLYRQAQDYAQQLKQSLTQLQEAQVQLVQSEKMSALGQMMSGITHEINNPLGFVYGNMNQVEEALQEVLEHLEIYQQNHPPGEAVTSHAEEIELEYLLEDLPEMLSSMKTGVNRIKEISKSMRIFSRADQEKAVEFDLHEGLDSTLLILKHRLKANEKRSEIQVIKDYGNLPQVNGFPGQLNQVFMNILANAVDVFDEMSQKQSINDIKQNHYQITVKTELNSVNKTINIQIKDNGWGMSEAVKSKVFEHLFTTKAVGKGTGLGLSIARQIVVDKHGGKLECDSTVGEGTEFIIQLPIFPQLSIDELNVIP
jgi:predicted ATPase/signal transduction histidine kinase